MDEGDGLCAAAEQRVAHLHGRVDAPAEGVDVENQQIARAHIARHAAEKSRNADVDFAGERRDDQASGGAAVGRRRRRRRACGDDAAERERRGDRGPDEFRDPLLRPPHERSTPLCSPRVKRTLGPLLHVRLPFLPPLLHVRVDERSGEEVRATLLESD